MNEALGVHYRNSILNNAIVLKKKRPLMSENLEPTRSENVLIKSLLIDFLGRKVLPFCKKKKKLKNNNKKEEN